MIGIERTCVPVPNMTADNLRLSKSSHLKASNKNAQCIYICNTVYCKLQLKLRGKTNFDNCAYTIKPKVDKNVSVMRMQDLLLNTPENLNHLKHIKR